MTSILYKLFSWPNTNSSLPEPVIKKEEEEEKEEEEPEEENKEEKGPVLIHIDGSKEVLDEIIEGDFIPFGSDGKCVQYDKFKFQPPGDYNNVASAETGIDIYGPATIIKKEVQKKKRKKKPPTVQKRRKSRRIATLPKRKRKYGSY